MANLVNLVYDSLQPSQRSLCLQRKQLSLHYTKIGDAGCIRLHESTPSTSPPWTLDQPGTVKPGLYFERKSTPYRQTILRTWGAYSRPPMPIYAVVIAQMASINTPTIRRLLR